VSQGRTVKVGKHGRDILIPVHHRFHFHLGSW
jgi:hypothetical protein